MTDSRPRRIGLVLGGGGLKGFAHLGVIRALEERGIRPVLFAGTSIGALIATAYAGGMSVDEMARRAQSLRRRDLFRLNHVGMLLARMRSTSLYLEETLRALCDNVCPRGSFTDCSVPVLVNTVDLERGTQLVWGLPGLRDVSVRDAVYASCALPGFFPPGRVGDRLCIDGGTIDNLPVSVAATAPTGGDGSTEPVDALIAVDVGSGELGHDADVATQGFASIYMRAATTMMHALQETPLARWSGPPMVLVRPRIGHISWFSFDDTPALIAEGYRAANEALDHLGEALASHGGVFPRRAVRLTVDEDRCTGCGLCVALAPQIMGLDARRKAYALTHVLEWSPADGDFVRHCPTDAIGVQRIERRPNLAIRPDETAA
ncbi:MAG TPA: patatin-like phospholipase family protein [Gemmatimonadaceae bacterium]|nr:patatin-like phospholipase family protein [Gemmatimonadaceae bacterium]